MRDPVNDLHITETCPHLGLAADPASRCLFVTDSHRCYLRPRPAAVGDEHQSAFCLSASFRNCPRLANPGKKASPSKAPQGDRPSARPRWKRLLGLIT